MRTYGTIGIIGGGQLAVMTAEAARRLGVRVAALAATAEDPIHHVVGTTLVGDARDPRDLRRLAAECEVLTFDHELVDPVVLALLEDEGLVFRPGATALAIATDKHRQLRLFRSRDLPVPDTVVVRDVDAAIDAANSFGDAVLKSATGGYDGRGVLLDSRPETIRSWFPDRDATVLVQPRLDIEDEVAVQVVRAVDGSIVVYPVVRTVQEDGMCAVVQVPSGLAPPIELEAQRIAMVIADSIDVVGVLAVEFFVVDGALVLNELAARPHNSGHVTLESARTSQFENHVRAVVGQPLGSTDLIVPAAAMANVVGVDGMDGRFGRLPTDVAVHLYGKEPRPGRKLGHVTSTAHTTEVAVQQAVRAARELEGRVLAS